MIDTSDGFLGDLGHICKASRTGAIIQTASLPIRKEVISVFGADATEMALSGGEDYQLLFTAKAEIMQQVIRATKYPVTVIGRIQEGNLDLVIAGGEVLEGLGLPEKNSRGKFIKLFLGRREFPVLLEEDKLDPAAGPDDIRRAEDLEDDVKRVLGTESLPG
jgi:hypothetical protein